MKQTAIAALVVMAVLLLHGCATQDRLELPVKLPVASLAQASSIDWQDERPPWDSAKSEIPTAVGFLVNLGDDISSPSTIEYLRNRLQADSSRRAAIGTVRVKRLVVTAESRNSWALLGYRQPIVALANWERKQMPIEYQSKVEVLILLEIDGKTIEAKSAIPFDSQPSALDIANAIKIAVENASRSTRQ